MRIFGEHSSVSLILLSYTSKHIVGTHKKHLNEGLLISSTTCVFVEKEEKY